MSEKPEVVAKECRFAVHIPNYKGGDDYHFVKERLHYKDGRTVPNIALIKNFKRPFGVTKKAYRNHQQKKEYEDVSKLTIHESTQSALQREVAKALDTAWSNQRLNQLSASPYLYGSDISSTTLIKDRYRNKWPDAVSSYSVAFFDIETDVLHDTEDPILATLIFEKEVLIVGVESFFQGHVAVQHVFEQKVKRYIQEYIDKHQLKITLKLVPDTVSLIKTIIGQAHIWSPDFLAIWNMDFDIPRLIKTLEKYEVDPKDVFAHPDLHPDLKFCKYKKGSTQKRTASGQIKPKKPSEQWHSLHCPAGFYVIDAMCSFRFIRQGEQERNSYSLDAILNEELGLRKLNFEEAEGYQHLEWHQFMQKNYPFEYAVYNIFDCIGMLELEKKTSDLSQALPVRSECTDFSKFNSQTKAFADKYYFFLRKRGQMISTIPPREEKDESEIEDNGEADDEEVIINPDDDENIDTKNSVLSLRNWIVTLSAHTSVLGRHCIIENPKLPSLIRGMSYDSDATAAYPSAAAVANVSKRTTVRELIDILGVEEKDFRRHNINLLQGHVNAVEYATEMFGLPKPQHSLCYFDDL